jgi:hypothetical protein
MNYEQTSELLRCIFNLKTYTEYSVYEMEKENPDYEHIKNLDKLSTEMEEKIFNIANR